MHSRKLSDPIPSVPAADFVLTQAVRPAPNAKVTPREGYRISVFRDPTGRRVPMLVAAVSGEHLFQVFVDLLEPLGDVVDVILETSHDSDDGSHIDRCREGIDLPVLLSHFYDHEELLLNDGCTGVAVLDEAGTMEVQFDEHKLLVIYAEKLGRFEQILASHGIPRDDRMKVITEGEHFHSTHPRYAEEFEQFCYRLGIQEMLEPIPW